MSNQAAIAKEGAIPLLLELLRCGDDACKTQAAGALEALAANAEYRGLIGRVGTIAHLLHLLKSGSAQGKMQAARALRALTAHDANLQVGGKELSN